jgi:hypothetical protein
MDPVTALKTGTEAISLVSTLAKLVREAKPGATPTLSELLGRLQVDAVRLSSDLENRIRSLSQNMLAYGLNPAMSLDQQLAELSWYSWATRSRLKAFREECFSIQRQLISFIDDATAMLVCDQKLMVAGGAFRASLETKRQLDAVFLAPNVPIGTLVSGMLATAERVSAELREP